MGRPLPGDARRVEQSRRLIGSVGTMEVQIALTGVPVTSLEAGRKATMLDPDGNSAAIMSVRAAS